MFGNPVTDALRAQNNPYENLIVSILQYESLPLNDLVFKRDNEERVKNVLSDFDSMLFT